MQKRPFGKLSGGGIVEAFTLAGAAGASLEVLTYGGIVRSIKMPDRDGCLADVVLGFDSLEPYLAGHPYFGAIAGRVAGRIPGGRFTLEGKTYELEKNDGPNHLHGGLRGLDKRVWKAAPNERADGADSVRLTYLSPDGEEGYPGAAFFCLDFTLTQDNVFLIESEVTVDRTTPVSLTHHSYFNLAGEGSGNIFGHELAVFSDRAFLVDELMTPLASTASVQGAANDFLSSRLLGEAIPGLFHQHGDCYLLPRTGALRPAARLSHRASGRTLEVSTDEHCVQVYTGASLDGSIAGKSGRPYVRHSGLCIECQGYPGAVTYPGLDSILVSPDLPQRHVTRYAFSTTKPDSNHE